MQLKAGFFFTVKGMRIFMHRQTVLLYRICVSPVVLYTKYNEFSKEINKKKQKKKQVDMNICI